MLRRNVLLGAAVTTASYMSGASPVLAQAQRTEGSSAMPGNLNTRSRTVASRDGTSIAYDRVGNGPPLIIVVGAFNDRFTGAPLAAALADQFTVYTYDRRGRGGSGDTQPYAIEREFEDLASVIEAAGGSASVFGFSSGSVLSMRAAATGLPIDKLILFGPPIVTDASRPPIPADIASRVKALVDAGRRGEAVEVFQSEAVGIPRPVVEQMRSAPFRPALEAMAHTLFYDLSIITAMPDPRALLSSIGMPALVIDGRDGPPWIRRSAEVIGAGLPSGSHLSIPGLTQDLKADLLAPPVRRFLSA